MVALSGLAPRLLAAPPQTVAITAPTNNATLSVSSPTPTVTVTASATSSGGGAVISSIDFRVNGVSIGTVAGGSASVALSTQWSPTAAGTYALTAVATDSSSASGNTLTSTTVTVTVSPFRQVTIVAPTNNASVPQGSQIFLRSTAAMSDGVISRVDFKLNGTTIATASASPFNAAATISATPGSYPLVAVATASDGTTTISSATNTLSVATAIGMLPTVSITAPTSSDLIGVGSTVTVTATASDSDGFIPNTTPGGVTFYADGDPIGTDLTAPYSVTWTPSVAKTVSLRALAIDDRGNSQLSTAVSVTVLAAITPATVSFNPPNSVTVNTTTTLTANVTQGSAPISQVQFLSGSTVLGTDTTAPYSFDWTPTTTGTVSLTAKVTDSSGGTVTSSPVSVTVASALPPTVSLTSPTNGAVIALGTSATLTASATVNGGAAISKVDFLAGSTVIGTVLTAPYTISWSPTAAGIVALTARATDAGGTAVTSPIVNVNVTGPGVALTSPAAGASVTVNTAVALTATASATSPATVTKVDFFAGSTLVGTATSSPYTVNWTPTTTGAASLTARVTDSNNATVTTSATSVTVIATPIVSATINLTAPANGTSVATGTPVTVSAAVVAGTSPVTKVDFLVGATVVGTAFSAPYSISWTPTTAGTFVVTARLTDGTGATVTSAGVNVVATAATRTVSIIAPADLATIPQGSVAFLRANASFSDGVISRVEFYLDGTLIGSDDTAPYNVAALLATAGNATLIARAVASDGSTVDSAPITLRIVAAVGRAPTVGIAAPTNGAFFPAGSPIAVSGSAFDADGTVTGVQLFANGSLVGSATVTGSTWFLNWTPTAVGTVALVALATDDKSNTSVSPELTVNVTDTTSPTLSVTITPGAAPGTTMPAGAVRTITVTPTPVAGRGIVRVEFFLDGSKIGEDLTAPYTLRFTAPQAAGSYLLSARATDNTGLSRDTQLPITVGNAIGQAPTIALLSPANGSTIVPATAVSVAASANAIGGSIGSVQFYVNGGTSGLSNNGLSTGPGYVVSFTPPSPGTYVLDAIAIDDRGNSRLSNAVAVTAAFASPTVVITSPPATSVARLTPNVPVTINATATGGSGSSVLLVEFLVDGAQVGVRTPTSPTQTAYSFQWTPASGQLGPHVITARVTDLNSQTATSNGVNVNVANIVGTPPTITITSPAGAATSQLQSLSTVNFIANAFATGAGNAITSVEFYLNDVSIGVGVREQTTNNLYRLAYNFAAYDFSAITPDAAGRFPLALYAIARDSNGNQTVTNPIALAINPSVSAAPTVSLQAIGNPTVAQGTAFLMVATPFDSDGTVTGLQLFVNGVASGGNIAITGPQVPVIYNATTAGRFNLFVVATDDTGNTAVSSPAIVLNVNAIAAPVTSMVRPADDSTVTNVNTPVFLEATATSADPTQVLTVSFVATGTSGARVPITNVQRVGTTSTYRAIWTPTVADTYTVTSTAAIGTIVSSNSANSRRVVATQIQGIPPVVSINVPGTVTTASSANFTATATDSDGSITSVEFFLNRNSIGLATRDQLTNTWRITARFASITPANGVEVVALARDTAGNVAASPTSTINIVAASSIAPTITIASSDLNPAFSRQVQLTANARDTDGTVTSVQYFQNATPIGTSGNAATNYQVNWTPNQSGTFNVWAIATDNSGITTVAPTIQVTVRRNAPVTEDAAFILQTYQDIANTTNLNPLVFESLNAQFDAGTLTRAQFATSLTTDPAFVPPVNLLAAYYVLMGDWPTAASYSVLLATARSSLPNAIGGILASNEFLAKFGLATTVTPALLNNPNGAMPARTFLARLHANAGLPPPSDTDLIRFMSNDTTFGGTLMRGYNVVGINTTLAEFVTNVNAGNATLMRKAQAAAIYYQLDRPTITVTTAQIATRVGQLAALPDMMAMVDAALKDVLYTYRFVTILQDPVSAVVAPRSTVMLSVDAIGQPPLTYQWLLNGAPVANATSPTLVISNASAANVGNYTVAITSAQASATSNAAVITLSNTPARLANISTRGPTGPGANVLIGGFVVTGPASQTRQMLIRVAGPALAAAPFNVQGTLADPRLEVYGGTSSTPLLTNDNWGTQPGGAGAVATLQAAATRAGAFAFANGSADAAVLANLPPGSYTVQAKGPNANATGVVLIEVYDVTQGAPAGPKAANVSTRGNVGTGDNILIAGFNVSGGVSRRLLIRGVGPTIGDPRFGLPAGSTLADPQLTLVNQATGAIVKVNDDWAVDTAMAPLIAAAAAGGGAFPLQTGSKDAAMLVMLAPGTYTVKLNGAGTATGIGIVEVYDVDP